MLVVANKVDDERREGAVWEFAKLGLGDAHAVSALHGRDSGDFLDALVAVLPPGDEVEPTASARSGERPRDQIFSVAIVGRPNVGKSTLFNRLVGEERAVVHDLPGTTRDSIDTVVETDDGPLRFVDTAGMRRRSRVDEPTEFYSVVRALQSVDRADACLFVLDATEGVTHQDQRLAERVDASGTAIVVVINKWDLLDTEKRATLKLAGRPRSRLPLLRAGATRSRPCRAARCAICSRRCVRRRRRITAASRPVPSTGCSATPQAAHPPPIDRRKRPRILYATQGATDPPTFTLFTNAALPPTYLRYLERRLRESFDLGPTPIKLPRPPPHRVSSAGQTAHLGRSAHCERRA